VVTANDNSLARACFGEAASRVIVAIEPADRDLFVRRCAELGVPATALGTVTGRSLEVATVGSVAISDLAAQWTSGLGTSDAIV